MIVLEMPTTEMIVSRDKRRIEKELRLAYSRKISISISISIAQRGGKAILRRHGCLYRGLMRRNEVECSYAMTVDYFYVREYTYAAPAVVLI